MALCVKFAVVAAFVVAALIAEPDKLLAFNAVPVLACALIAVPLPVLRPLIALPVLALTNSPVEPAP